MSATVKRCYSILVGLAKLCHQLPRETKRVIIEGLVHPCIRYCITVWGGCSKTQRQRIQKTLNFGARIIAGIKRTEHISPTLESLGWLKVDKFLSERDLMMLFHLQKSPQASEILRELVVPRSDVSVRTTRGSQSMMLELPLVNSEFARRQSFVCRAIGLWNRLPPDVRVAQSAKLFRAGMMNWLVNVG